MRFLLLASLYTLFFLLPFTSAFWVLADSDAPSNAASTDICAQKYRPVPMFGGDASSGHSDHHNMASPFMTQSSPSSSSLSSSLSTPSSSSSSQQFPAISTVISRMINPFSWWNGAQPQQLHQSQWMTQDDHHMEHDHGAADEDYTDVTKWSQYPQKSQNAHIIIGALTSLTLYIWACNVFGFLSLSKAYILTGLTQIAQGAYLFSWLFYFLYPQDLTALHDYVLHDVMEMQHIAIGTCLFVAGFWDAITGWFLHWQVSIFYDSYSPSRFTPSSQRQGVLPNNLWFFQAVTSFLVMVAHFLNGSNFIKHPQHSEENTWGHVMLGLLMMLGGFCFFIVRIRHRCWEHLYLRISPAGCLDTLPHVQMQQLGSDSSSLSSNNRTTHSYFAQQTISSQPSIHSVDHYADGGLTSHDSNINNNVVWQVGTRYSLDQLTQLSELQKSNQTLAENASTFSWDIFAFESTQPPSFMNNSNMYNNNTNNHDNNNNDNATPTNKTIFESIDDDQDEDESDSILSQLFRSSGYSSNWDTSILDVQFRKPRSQRRPFHWKSVSTHSSINMIYNSYAWLCWFFWKTRSFREISTFIIASLSTYCFYFISTLLMTFIEPPVRLHYQHYYKCFNEYWLVKITLIVNLLLSGPAICYLILCILHNARIIYMPSLFRISWFTK